MPEDRHQASAAARAGELLIPVIWYLPSDHGAIAQLGERLLCKQEVTGSIPVGSTRANNRNNIGSTRANVIDEWIERRSPALRLRARRSRKSSVLRRPEQV